MDFVILNIRHFELKLISLGLAHFSHYHYPSKALARRASRRPMDARFLENVNKVQLIFQLIYKKHVPWTANFQFLAKSLCPSHLESVSVFASMNCSCLEKTDIMMLNL